MGGTVPFEYEEAFSTYFLAESPQQSETPLRKANVLHAAAWNAFYISYLVVQACPNTCSPNTSC